MRADEEQLGTWMARGLDGDATAHATLLAALVPLLRAFFRRRLADGATDAEDLVQETLIAVHTRRATYDRERRFMPWLFAIARHKLIDHTRRTRATCPIEDVEAILVGEGFEGAANAHIDVERLLGTLPAKQARTIQRTKLDGLSTAEAALDGGIGESDVKVSVHRGLKALTARVLGMRR